MVVSGGKGETSWGQQGQKGTAARAVSPTQFLPDIAAARPYELISKKAIIDRHWPFTLPAE